MYMIHKYYETVFTGVDIEETKGTFISSIFI